MSTAHEEMILRGDWYTLSFNPEVPCVYQVCEGAPSSEEFRSAMMQVIELLETKSKSYPVVQCLVDTTRLINIDYKDLEWTATEGNRLLYKNGARKIAFIIANRSIYSQFYLNIYEFKAKRITANLVRHKLFYSMETAIKWLKEQE